MPQLTPTALLLLAAGALAAPNAPPLSLLPRAPNPPTALPQSATANDLRWQPSLDFDTDGCYNVPAIDAQGNIAQGLEHNFVGLSSDCHDLSDLDNNNVYSRQRCNSGWCVYLYGYYFEKDVAVADFIDVGHTHDWEHIAVWVSDETGKAEWVGASQHGGFEIKAAADVRWDGEHPKMVYHKDGASTHCFRFGNTDDDNIENAKGVWFRGALVSYNGFPSADLRNALFAHDFGKATIGFKDDTFASHINSAKPGSVSFDVNTDNGSPGTP
ncbi:necrosis inducing protein-domain-containing protein [Chaetomium sp. MPI-SDFR-AT-0129]|nr:necrosis inducing protein-domain-containing protein [Chaetomium sp. MPI-SDFR-AT-0129]